MDHGIRSRGSERCEVIAEHRRYPSGDRFRVATIGVEFEFEIRERRLPPLPIDRLVRVCEDVKRRGIWILQQKRERSTSPN